MPEAPSPRSVRCLIIGAGPAGYTAAVYAARALLHPVLIAGLVPGGQMTITTDVENYPGFADVIQGPWLMEQMQLQAAHVGTEMVSDVVVAVDLSRRPFRLVCDSGQVWLAETLIIATGAQAKWLGLPSEQKFQGFGVSACATCDGFFFREREVLSKRPCSSPTSPPRSRWCIAAMSCGPKRSCRSACSPIPRSR